MRDLLPSLPFSALRTSSLLCAKLSQRTEPVFKVVGPSDLAIFDGLYIDRHDPKALAGMRHTKKIASRRSGYLAANDDPIAGDEDFLDVELHVGDRLGKATDDFDGGLTAPALARQIPPAGLVVRGKDLLLQRPHIALDRLVEQYIPGRDHGARLRLRQCLCGGGHRNRHDDRGHDELGKPLHRILPSTCFLASRSVTLAEQLTVLTQLLFGPWSISRRPSG